MAVENYWTMLKEGSTWAHILGVTTMKNTVWSLERCDDQTRMQAEHTASAIRDEDALLAVSLFFSSGPLPIRWCHPHSWRVFPP